MARFKSHRFDEYGDQEGLRMFYQMNDWSCFVQQERDDATIRIGKTFPKEEIYTLGDMSAGGSHITPTLADYYGCPPTLGDLGQQYNYPNVGTLQETLPKQPVFDLYVCSETLEHLRDPDSDLALIRQHAKYLLLTTPIMEKPHLVSHGHLWTWEQDDIEAMLHAAGFEVVDFEPVLIFGIWKAR
jgi:hypothetical protein